MAVKQWFGGAQAIKQVSTITIGGTAATSDTFTISVGFATLTYTVGGTTDNATIAAGLLALINATDAPNEYKDAVWTANSNVITATGKYAGVPFTPAVQKVSTSGTIAHSVVTSATGPNHLDNAANWSGGSLPADVDTVVFTGAISALYGLQTDGPFAEIQVLKSFTGQIGLPELSGSGYREYRKTYCEWSAASLKIGGGNEGQGSSRLKFNCLTTNSNVLVYSTSNSNDSAERSLQLIGEMNSVTIESGSVSVAGRPLETATVVDLEVGSGANVQIGQQVTLTNVTSGGTTTIQSDSTQINVTGGQCTISDCATADVDISGGALIYDSSETIDSVVVGPGVLDCTDLRTRTCTELTLRRGGVVADPRQSLTITTLLRDTSVGTLQAS